MAKNENIENTISPELLAQLTAQITAQVKSEIQTEMENQEPKEIASNEALLVKEEKSMKERILAEPKKAIFVPEDPNNPDERQPIAINGIIFSVKKGVMVEVPESVAAVWEHSYTTTKKVMKRIKVTDITNQSDLEIKE